MVISVCAYYSRLGLIVSKCFAINFSLKNQRAGPIKRREKSGLTYSHTYLLLEKLKVLEWAKVRGSWPAESHNWPPVLTCSSLRTCAPGVLNTIFSKSNTDYRFAQHSSKSLTAVSHLFGTTLLRCRTKTFDKFCGMVTYIISHLTSYYYPPFYIWYVFTCEM